MFLAVDCGLPTDSCRPREVLNMKRLIIFVGLCLLAVNEPVFSQTVSAVSSPSIQNSKLSIQNSGGRPVATPIPAGPPSPTTTPLPKIIYSPAPQLDLALKKAMLQITKDLKAGKLTKAQATSYRGQVVAIRKQELADITANGKRQLTPGQENQLRKQLSQIESSL